MRDGMRDGMRPWTVGVAVVGMLVSAPAFARLPREGARHRARALLRMRPWGPRRAQVAQVASRRGSPSISSPSIRTSASSFSAAASPRSLRGETHARWGTPKKASQIRATTQARASTSTGSSRPRPSSPVGLTPIDIPSSKAHAFYERGWFWPLVGGVAAAIIVTIIVAESVGGDARMPQGSLGTINVTL